MNTTCLRRRTVSLALTLALLSLLAAGLFTAAPVPTVRAASFSVGDNVVVSTDYLNMRAAPGLSSAVVRVLANGSVLKIEDGPVDADGYTWYKGYYQAGGGYQADHDGWFVDAFVTLFTSAPDGSCSAPPNGAESASVATDWLNMRSGPGLSYPVVATLPQGKSFLLGCAVTADGYTWYGVSYPSQPVRGWVAGEFLTFDNGSNGGSNSGEGGGNDGTWSGGFGIGDTAVVDTGSLNCRSGPGLSNGVVAVLPGEQTVSVLDGPQAADGYHWFQVKTADGTTCWVIGEGLRPGTSGGGGGSFAAGDQVIVSTDFLNLRGDASTSAAVLRTLPTGTPLTVMGGPQRADGHTWYAVTTADGMSGWVAGEFLAAAA